ncbi:unnamed protein product [marine sediment metagenome]|uniref:Uncharacterized protein n=1 Tax=marine sediment metagenome TaxID=412755 RepID=X1L2S9_9ZZZZ
MKYLKLGKDREGRPCIEFDDGPVVPIDELIFDQFKKGKLSKK